MANDTRTAELNLKIANQATQTNAGSKKELAIVSPCSTCKNYSQSTTGTPDPYRSLCPRRTWIQQQTQNAADQPGLVDPVLYTSGTNDPNTLANPVVDKTTGNYVVWVATIEDNPGIVNEQTGGSVTPGILDSNFNNLYIKCRLYPYVPEQHHDTLRSTGAFQENDKVTAIEHRVPPLNPTVTYAGQAGAPPNQQILYQSTPIAGTVSKTSFAYFFDTTNPDDHGLVPG